MKQALIFSLMMLLVTGCSSNQTSPSPQAGTPVVEEVVVNIAVITGPTALGMIKLIDEEPSLGDNVTTHYEIVLSPDILVSKLLSGEFDIAALPTNLAATLYNKGAGYQLLAMNTWGVLYIVSTDTSISSWDDLKGRTINTFGRGATPDVVLRYLLSANSIDPDKDVTIDYSIPQQTGLASAMIAGKVDTALLPEPLVTMVTTKNSDLKIVIDLQSEWEKIHGADIPMAQGSLVVRKEFAEKNPEIVAAFLTLYEESISWVNTNPEQAGVLVEKHIGIPAKIAEKAIPRSNIRFMTAMDARQPVERYLEVLYNFSPRTVGGKMPDEGFYYSH